MPYPLNPNFDADMAAQKSREPHRQPWDRLYYLPETRISKAVGALSILMAGVLLVGAIISLYFVTGPAARLGLLTVWTVLFAFSVSVLSTARRSELFAATAAYGNLPITSMTSLTLHQVRCGAGSLCER